MYDRAPRKICFIIGSTPKNVGPGSYNHPDITCKKLTGDGYAPFMTMASRESYWNPSDDTIAAPGPGQYDPELPQDYIKGASALLSTSKRFQLKPLDTPGPGSYEVDHEWRCSIPLCLGRKSLSDFGPQIYTKRVKFYRKSAAPSIPCQNQSYGYEENADGSLKRQQVPVRDTSLGPAYYAPESYETCTTKMYKGIHFGKMKSGRMKMATNDGPGPGQYEPFIDCKSFVENISAADRDKCKFESFVPRYLDKIVENEKRQGVPGPGRYDISRQFDACHQTDRLFVEHAPFMIQAKRFQPIRNDVPAPGTYNDPRTAMENLKKLCGMKQSPFGRTSVRFEKDHVDETPGPAAYRLKGIAEEIEKRVQESCMRRCAFGACAERGISVTLKDAPDLPGPATYQIPEKPCRPKVIQLSSNFASQTQRSQTQPGLVLDIPPPGSYEVIEAFQNATSKCRRKCPRTEEARKRQGSFLSSSSRFAPPRDIIVPEPDPCVPGPGMYYPKFPESNRISITMSKDCRFRKPDIDDTPGPGTYEFSPMIQDTILKGTFNSTLNNPFFGEQGKRPRPEIKPDLCT